MCAKDAHRQKIEAELELVQAKLAEFEAPAKSLTADIRIKSTSQADNLKRKIDIIKAQLKRRGEANKDFWDLLRYCF
jgi:VIT1/CCC1 family predicted Fe2+/Mn2+ transporter